MTIRKAAVLIILGAVVLLLVPYSIPLILALLTAMMLEPLVLFLIRNLKVNRGIAVTISFVLFFAFFGYGGYWLGTKLIVQAVALAQHLPAFSARLFESAEKYIWMWQTYYASLPAETVRTIQQVIGGLKNSAVNAASSLAEWVVRSVAALPGLFLISIVYLIGLFLISLDLPRIRVGFFRMFTPSAREKVELIMTQLGRATVGFLQAQFILSLLTYILALVGLLILQVKYAAVIAFLIVIVDILPILGTGSFLVPWAVYSFMKGNPHLAIGLVVLFLVITVIRRIIEPKILGSSLGISALAALTSMYLGFQLIGFFGLILGPAVVIVIEALRKAGFLKFKIDF
ncbi:sporulation integral membrane protein YtvI [Effusibacillus lacus]|uniref:Sporulation integral membrane protein YtvI n=2 Tax=Effusibacillus lacus TaxID=1348429 RepID=A0A292YGQ9_9BACL|nr:sporulation integral membrane protein YtvI [Effusibacillus lacus]